jgi:regulatory protein
LRQRLHKLGFGEEVVEETAAKLKEQDIIGDFAFAQFWKDSRLSSKPRSKRLIIRELREKKVGEEIAEDVARDIDDEANAYRLGCSRLPFWANLDYPAFYRRLAGYLSYRGFSYEVIRLTAVRLWRERKGNDSD